MFSRYIGSFGAKFAVSLINLGILLLTSRYLGTKTRGEISLWVLNIFIFQMLAEIFTGYSLVHFIPKTDFKKIFLYGYFFVFGIIVCGLSYYFFSGKPLDFSFYFLTVFVILNSFNFVFFLGLGELKLYNIFSLMQPFLLLTGTVMYIFLFKNQTFNAWKIPAIFSFFITYLTTLSFVIRLFSRPGSSDIKNKKIPIKEIIRNGMLCQMANLFFVLSGRYNFYQIEALDQLGIYSTASMCTESLLIFSSALSPIILSDTSSGRSNRLNFRFAAGIAALMLLIFCIILVIPESWILFFFGNYFKGIKNIILLLFPGIFFHSQTSLIHHYFSGSGNLYPAFFSNGTGFLITYIFSSYVALHFGLSGLAVLSSVSAFVILLTSLFFVKKIFSKRLLQA
jgi:O-antigen/teichoic acid export membrane protein